jgi:soluble lytic murein transglycosylase
MLLQGTGEIPMRFQQYIYTIIALMSFSAASIASNSMNHDAYLKAESHLNKSQYPDFHKTMASLGNHPLKPYLEARWIRRQFYRTPIADIDGYLKKYDSQPPARALNRQWVKYLAKKQKWQLFLDYYRPTSNLTLQCYRITALESTSHQFEAISEGQALWLKGVSLPKSCDKVFKNWKRIGYLSQDLIWQRLINAQEKKQYKLVRYLKKQLPNDARKQFKIVQNAWRRPLKTFTDNRLHGFNSGVKFTLLKRALKKHPDYWFEHKLNPIFLDLDSEQNHQLRDIAIESGARGKTDNQHKWYLLAQQENVLTDEFQERFLQGAVQNQNWILLSHFYKLSSDTVRSDGKWQYWNARALELLGAPYSITMPFYELASTHRDYYGFLASQQLGVSASMNHDPTHVDASVVQRTRIHPNVKRALAFLDLKRIPQARREWQHAFNSLDENGRQALALLAGRLEWSDRAIMTLAQLRDWHDLQLRFPLAHEPLFDKAAKRSNIEKTWIYGIARQESAFMHDARSPVGATGLMQLMPRTAKSVSKRLRLKYSSKKLVDPNYNVRLGSHYLKTLLKRYKGNRVLATAAYNAGPTNVKRWLKRFDGPLDIWIENIPFNETKEYVQRVLAYSTIYSYRLGGLQPIFDRKTLSSWHDQSIDFLNISRVARVQNTQG